MERVRCWSKYIVNSPDLLRLAFGGIMPIPSIRMQLCDDTFRFGKFNYALAMAIPIGYRFNRPCNRLIADGCGCWPKRTADRRFVSLYMDTISRTTGDGDGHKSANDLCVQVARVARPTRSTKTEKQESR